MEGRNCGGRGVTGNGTHGIVVISDSLHDDSGVLVWLGNAVLTVGIYRSGLMSSKL